MNIAGVNIKPEWVLWGVAAGAALLWMRGLNRTVADTSETIFSLPGSAVQGTLSGLLGIPRTDTPEAQDKCAAALAAGDDWTASFNCPAAKAIGGWFDAEWF